MDAALIRTTTLPENLQLPAWPDLNTDDTAGWRTWLEEIWRIGGFADAVRSASPELSAQVERQLRSPAASRPRQLRRLVEAVVRYLLRWTSRATPFGLLAGIAPVEFGPRAALRWDGHHRAVTRPDGRFLDEQTGAIEQRLEILREVPLVRNSLGFRRGRSWVVPCASTQAHLADIEISLSAPVRLALESAQQPIVFKDLAAKLAAEAPEAELALVEDMLAALVGCRALLSAVRPPMTVTDPAAHLARYAELPEPAGQVAIDVRVGCSVTVPAAVLREAEDAAAALVAVAPELPGWRAYHHAFIERYGPKAVVPVRELVGETGLGFPAGYRGSRHHNSTAFTPREMALAEIAQQAALDGCAEVVLDDALISRLGTGWVLPPVPHTELRFSLAAESLHDVERGAFTLTVLSGARHAGVSASRFLHLLNDSERERFRRAYAALPTATPGALAVQLSGPPLVPAMTAVARTPEILPILPIGEYREKAEVSLEDLAVTGDGRRLWLVSVSQGRPVEPLLFNAVDLRGGQQPLLRFLAEISTARSAACRPFTWGSATRELPFLPRIRRGRAILAPARWSICADALPRRTASWREWRRAWERLRQTSHLPREVMLGADDVRIRLDLAEPAHLTLLRRQLDRRSRAVLTEADGPPGWFGGRPHELVITLAHTSSPGPQPEQAKPVRPTSDIQHRPGLSEWLYVQLHGRQDEILSRLTEWVDDSADGPAHGWWFIRYHRPQPHLRVRLRLHSAARFGAAARRLGHWADRLHADGLLRDYTIHTYRPEARFGTGLTLAAAEAVFAADSRTAIRRLTADRQAATAAGMIRIADAFTGEGPRWLIDHATHRSGPPVHRDQITQASRPYPDPDLEQALADYRGCLERDGLDGDQVLADLLHLHHARMIGIDTASEQHCLRLARAAAHARLARGRS